ncbi:polymorphic toxin type 28 domain-containing protein [Streptomyces sp. 184]|uniref:polymorphic toxin type 28 domain-containing protein n=1 Tax=Streptomyces sp. 184 TaxID=1827526 RepID=UPI003891F4E6
MGSRPTDWHVLDLDEDPTPGDPERVRQLARELHDFADDVADALRQIKGMAGEDALLRWAGKTAKAFQDEFEEVPKNLRKLQRSYDLAGDALAAYWPKLERAQSLADKALAKGREAQSDLTAANGRLDSASSWVERATDKTKEYDEKEGKEKPDESEVRAATRNATDAKSARSSAQTAVDNAQGGLEAAKKMAADAKKMREDAASEAKDKLEDASDAGIQNRKWWEKAVDWVKDNWDTIVTVCKVIVAVLGIVVLIIGGPLAWVVLAAALVVLADTLYKYANGEASLFDVAMAALDCIPGLKGLTSLAKLGKGLKSLKGGLAGLRSMKNAVLGLAKRGRTMIDDAAQGATTRLKNIVSKFTDPVDLATGQMYLPLSDIELPGLLPLAFSRRLGSTYRTGWWFGPTWASTVDQRLETDDQGVVFVTEDGRLLAYPHPAGTDTAVLPEQGPRWPLVRLESGGYAVTDPLTGHTRTFARPDAEGLAPIERIADRNGHTIDFAYDEDGAPTDIRHSGGYHLKLTSDDGRVTALSLAGAADDGTDVVVKRFGYDAAGNLTEDTNSSGLPLVFTYDHRLRATSWTDRNGHRYDYTYDAQDRCTAEAGEAGHLALTLDYDGTDPAWPDATVTTLTTAAGATTRFVVNDNCQIVAEIDALGHTTRAAYDAHHNLTEETDALGGRFAHEYDAEDNLRTLVRPDGTTTTLDYAAPGLPTRVTAPDGATWVQSFDEAGNRLSVADPSGATTRFHYDAQGRLRAVTDALDHTFRIENNAAGLPVETVDPLGGTTRYEYDAFGRVRTVTDPLGHATRATWNTEGLLTSYTLPDGTTESWTYDAEGNCVGHTDAGGAVTAYEYTHFDQLSAYTTPDGARYEFAHDASLRLTAVTDPLGRRWQYVYDLAGRLVSETDFDGRTTEYVRDAAGRVTASVTPLGERVAYEFDALGNVLGKDAAGARTTYTYDAAGRLLSAAGPDSVVTYERNESGLVTKESVDGRSLSFGYDALGRRVRRVTPSGALTSYGYDAAGRREAVTAAGHTLRFERDAGGRERACVLDGSLSVEQRWDPVGRLHARTVSAGERTVQQRTYTYRGDGNLVAVHDRLAGVSRFDVDAVGRVTGVVAGDWRESYGYDAVGNVTRAAWPDHHADAAATGERTYAGTRVRGAGALRYEHDAAGRLVARTRKRLSHKPDTWRFTWDAEDRLTQAATPDGTVWRYRYDPLGRRIAKERLSGDGEVAERIEFTWDGAVLVEETARTAGLPHPVTLTWEHDGFSPIAQAERITDETDQREVDSRFFAIVSDLVGTPRELVDADGQIAWRARSTIWGTTAWSAKSTAYTPLRLPGQYADRETGLHYNLHRYYDPALARYATPDPLGLSPAPNPVAYVHNPLTWSDPLGLSPYSSRKLGLSDSAQNAIQKLENIKKDPIGKINSMPNHNHYSAARREAAGEVVAVKQNGVPFDHIADLTNARNGLENVRKVLVKEMDVLPEGLTERGLDVLIKKHDETVYHLDRLNGFLGSIGHR